MQIERLRLKNFRCYDELDIDFEPKLTVIVGENGKGKTAIFDALAIALEPYLRSFDASGRQITPQDVRRVPVYKKDMRHIDGMECHYPVEIKLEGEVYGKKLTCQAVIIIQITQAGAFQAHVDSVLNRILQHHIALHLGTVLLL